MRTVIIFDQLDAKIKFLVVDGDYRHLNDVYINTDNHKIDELNKLIYDQKTWEFKVPVFDEFPLDVVRNEDTWVIVAGFLP